MDRGESNLSPVLLENMFNQKRNDICEEATNRLNKILGGSDYFFKFNSVRDRFEFWEDVGPVLQMVFPLTLNNEPLNDVTDWEIYHAVNWVRKKREKEVKERYIREGKYKKQILPDAPIDLHESKSKKY